MLEDERAVLVVHASLKKSKPWQGALGQHCASAIVCNVLAACSKKRSARRGARMERMFGTQRLIAGYVLPPHSRKSALIGEWNLRFGEGG